MPIAYPCQPWARDGLTASRLYAALHAAYGPQGWWPLASRAGQPGYDAGGYHLGLFNLPSEADGRLEILVGAILTQNTAWRNVSPVMGTLADEGLLVPRTLMGVDETRLAALIRPAGYFNQKAKKILLAVRIGMERGWWQDQVPSRDELLAIWGIGPETADCILLYAWHRPSFVVDAYTRRLLGRLDWGGSDGLKRLPFDPLTTGYEAIRRWFMDGLEATASQNPVQVYQEFHALIVHHAKVHCRARPSCSGCVTGMRILTVVP